MASASASTSTSFPYVGSRPIPRSPVSINLRAHKQRGRRLRPMASASAPAGYDRLSELKAFDDTKAGVKGLVDAGVTAVPRIFHHPAARGTSSTEPPSSARHDEYRVPVIDLADTERSRLVSQVKAAAETVGFFQVVNHGVPDSLLAETLASVRKFHEEPAEAKRPYYSRDPARRVRYQSNFDLFYSPAASWRDTLFMESGAAPDEVPAACRGVVVPEYTAHVRRLGSALLGLLSEALGLQGGYDLERDIGGLQAGLAVAGHYYPPCPEPHRTVGTAAHSDASFLTVLLQDAVGGLQVLVGGDRRRWVDVPPEPGALVVNVGDLLQLVSNDRFKSVEHRVVSKAAGPRVSVGCFFRAGHGDGRVYGPIVGGGERPRYRSVTMKEYLGYFMNKGLDGRSALDHFRL